MSFVFDDFYINHKVAGKRSAPQNIWKVANNKLFYRSKCVEKISLHISSLGGVCQLRRNERNDDFLNSN